MFSKIKIKCLISLVCLSYAVLAIVLNSTANAQAYFNGKTAMPAQLEDILLNVKAGTVVVMSEQHDKEAHHQNQRDFLVSVSGGPFSISVGMEFFSYPDQAAVDDYVFDRVSEDDFLKKIKWQTAGLFSFFNFSNFPFSFYRFQVRLPAYKGGRTLALNFPRELSGKVAKSGLDGLSDAEKLMMPPNFERGLDSYFERFHEVMKGHAKEEQIQNYFMAQSLWDDTMAWKAADYMSKNPNQFLMIIVGDFHVAYQDGLIARLKKRGIKDLLVVSQVDSTGMSDSDRQELISADPKYGPRADFVFDSKAK